MFGTTPEVDSVIRRLEMRDALAVRDDQQRVAHGVEIIERLAHAHHHDIGDAALAGRHHAVGRPVAARPIAQAVARHHHLADDFAGGEIAHQALRAGVTECAGERAADLARDAQRAALGVGDVDALHLVRTLALYFARQPQQPFARAVDGNLLGHDFGARQRETLAPARRATPSTRWSCRRMREAAEIDPVPELLHAHLALRFRHADLAQRVGRAARATGRSATAFRARHSAQAASSRRSGADKAVAALTCQSPGSRSVMPASTGSHSTAR